MKSFIRREAIKLYRKVLVKIENEGLVGNCNFVIAFDQHTKGIVAEPWVIEEMESYMLQEYVVVSISRRKGEKYEKPVRKAGIETFEILYIAIDKRRVWLKIPYNAIIGFRDVSENGVTIESPKGRLPEKTLDEFEILADFTNNAKIITC